MDSMYAYIKGELAEKNIDSIVVEAAGVGYLIYIPTQYFDMLPDEGEDVKIYTYLCVREDAMILYGFLSKDDLEIFKLLITVSGIGPRAALPFCQLCLPMICVLRFYRGIQRLYQRHRE